LVGSIINSNATIKQSDILKIIKEDVLRILGERKEKVSLEVIKSEGFIKKISHIKQFDPLVKSII